MTPDANGRIDGTTYPSDRAPEGAEPLQDRRPTLRERIAARLLSARVRWSVAVLRPQAGDVLIVRTPHGASSDETRALGKAWRRITGTGVVVVLPTECSVHAEPPRIRTEDRGYRETRTAGNDRGVHVGVPGAPEGTSPPRDDHGRSEGT